MPLASSKVAVFSTYVTGFCTLLARYFPGCASRSISMRPRTEFAKGSNFRNLDLFGSGYAGLGLLVFPCQPQLGSDGLHRLDAKRNVLVEVDAHLGGAVDDVVA